MDSKHEQRPVAKPGGADGYLHGNRVLAEGKGEGATRVNSPQLSMGCEQTLFTPRGEQPVLLILPQRKRQNVDQVSHFLENIFKI